MHASFLCIVRRLSTLQDLFLLLDKYCDNRLPLLHPDKSQVITALQTRASLRAKAIGKLYWLQRPLFDYLTHSQVALVSGDRSKTNLSEMEALETLLQQFTCLEQASALVLDAQVKELAKILVMEEMNVNTSEPVHAHGVDWRLATELRHSVWCRDRLKVDFPLSKGGLDVGVLV